MLIGFVEGISMSPAELATKIAEEVFRTIEREGRLIKADISEAIERVLAPAAAKSMARPKMTEEELAEVSHWAFPGLFPPPGSPLTGEQHRERFKAIMDAGSIPNPGKPSVWKVVKTIDATGHNVQNAVTSAKYLGADYLDQDGQVKAFERFTQYVGLPRAYYTTHDGALYRYQTLGWQSDDPAKVVAKVDALAAHVASLGGHTIIWRQKPSFTLEDGKWQFYCRCHILPYVHISSGFEKPEGEPFPEA
jgi:hypothetical protein